MKAMIRNVVRMLVTGAVSVTAYQLAVGLFAGGVRGETRQPPTLQVDPEKLARVTELASVMKAVGEVMEPAVVQINSVQVRDGGLDLRLPDLDGDGQPDMPPGFDLRQRPSLGAGSGVIVEVQGDTGYLVTNNHVAGNASEIVVTLSDGRRISDVKVVGTDPRTDLAVLEITAPGLTPARWGDSQSLQRGDIVLAFGAPFGYVGSMTQGIVSGLDRQTGMLGQLGYDYFIQTDAAINPGNSGGPLVNIRGEVVGINTAIATQTGAFNGIGLAIPSHQAKFVYQELRANGRVVRGYLGVQISDVTVVQPERLRNLRFEDRAGVFVGRVERNTPASGVLQPDDIITAINGQPVRNAQQLRMTIATTKPGSQVQLEVFRDGQTQTLSVTLGEQPSEEQLARASRQADSPAAMGMVLADPDAPRRRSAGVEEGGAVITRINPGSLAAQAGLDVGDVITRIGDTPVADAEHARRLLADVDLNVGLNIRAHSRDGDMKSAFIRRN